MSFTLAVDRRLLGFNNATADGNCSPKTSSCDRTYNKHYGYDLQHYG